MKQQKRLALTCLIAIVTITVFKHCVDAAKNSDSAEMAVSAQLADMENYMDSVKSRSKVGNQLSQLDKQILAQFYNQLKKKQAIFNKLPDFWYSRQGR